MIRIRRNMNLEPEWVGEEVSCLKRNPFTGQSKTYKSFRFRNLEASVGDYILVSADPDETNTIEGSDVARIEHLFQFTLTGDKYRANVQWYSKPSQMPSEIDNEHMDGTYEVVEDYRKFDCNVSVETIYKKCKVINAYQDDIPADMWAQHNTVECPVFICRYRLLQNRMKFFVEPVLPLDEDSSNYKLKQLQLDNRRIPATVLRTVPNLIITQKPDTDTKNESADMKKKVVATKENISTTKLKKSNQTPNSKNKNDISLRKALRKCSIDSDSEATATLSPSKIIKFEKVQQPLRSIANQLDALSESDSDHSSSVIIDKNPSRRSIAITTPVRRSRRNSAEVVESTPQTMRLRNPIRKRKAYRSSSEESFEPRSRSISPEIASIGPAAAYKLYEEEGHSYVVKKPIDNQSISFQKLDDSSISLMLSSDDSDSSSILDKLVQNGETIVAHSKSNHDEFELVENSNESFKHSYTIVPKSQIAARKSSRISEKMEIKDTQTARKVLLLKQLAQKRDDASLRIKLRRSTEQSTYKIDTDSDHSSKSKSRRSNAVGISKSSKKLGSRRSISPAVETSNNTENTKNNSPTSKLSKQLLEVRITKLRDDIDVNKFLTNKSTISPHVKRNELHDSPTNTVVTPTKRLRGINRCNREKLDNTSISEILSDTDKVAKRAKPPTRAATTRNSCGILAKKKVSFNPEKQRANSASEIDSSEIDDENLTDNRCKMTAKKSEPLKNINDYNTDIEQDANYNLRVRNIRSRRISGICSDLSVSNEELNKELPQTRTPSRRKYISHAQMSSPSRRNKQRDDQENTPITPKRNTKTSKAQTPSKAIKNGLLTPSMRQRNVCISKPETPLQEARARLHVSAVPKSLPCREEEFNNIYTFLQGKLLDHSGGCMYISGVPGTGKTATVNEVIRCLKKSASKGKFDNFQFIEINGMKLTEPRQSYVEILKQLTGKKVTWEQAHETLDNMFTKASTKRPMTLLLVDELDILCNKRQDVVYNLLDWPAKSKAQLVVITIANTMDLPERVLMGRVTSRLGLTRLTFQPYTFKQLQEIVTTRLNDSNAFKSEAIQFVARKVAAVSGDARRALDICRRATEIAELNNCKIVNMPNVNQALTEMIASAKVQAIRHCSEMERTFLQAVCAEVARTGVEEVTFNSIYTQLISLCAMDGLQVPTITETIAICSRLGASRLLICEHSRTDVQQRILLNVSPDDVYYSMQTIEI